MALSMPWEGKTLDPWNGFPLPPFRLSRPILVRYQQHHQQQEQQQEQEQKHQQGQHGKPCLINCHMDAVDRPQ